MQAVKKAVKSVIEREQRRVLVVTLSHDDGLVLKGDNVSIGYVENNDSAKEALKAVLKTADTYYMTRPKIWTFQRCLQS